MRWFRVVSAGALVAVCAAGALADEMFAWERLARQTARAERLPAAQTEETLDMVRAAIDDAVNATAPFGAGGPSADVAAAVAAHDVLVKLFPTRKARLDARLDRVHVQLDESVLEAAALAGHQAAESVLASEWTWRRTRLPGGPRKLPAVKAMTLPLHKSAAEPMTAPPAKASRL